MPIDFCIPAFPHNEKSGEGEHLCTHEGMNIFEYLVGQCIVGMLANTRSHVSFDDMASAAVKQAQALLVAIDKSSGFYRQLPNRD
jgi:hypothetical protein